MGITTPISTNPAMTIGGLSVGVTPLDMAHAYETIAHGGERVSGTMAKDDAPVGIQEVEAGGHSLPDGARHDTNMVETKRILPSEVAATETSVLETVLEYGTAKAAALGEFAAGKTGTTSNYGDAWFVGWNHKYTVAVWVGYPNGLVPMTTQFNGTPVLGGTFPALIWHNFLVSALQVERARAEHTAHPKGSVTGGSAGTSSPGEAETGAPATTNTAPSRVSSPANGTGRETGKESGRSATPGGGSEAAPGAPAKAGSEPEHTATPTPTPESPSAPSSPAPATPSSPSPTGGVSPGG
jgi:penicillin-binding protein 1A